ncbi:MAG: hypothetical protein K5931_00100 [Lachnospiraceae bacterium]|nr:hypothetical protein [Lachnospiraceae bacterium]
MKKLWNVINQLRTGKSMKNRIYLMLLILINIIIGGAIWLLIGRLLLPGIEWLICFMGYPAVFIGFFGGVLYLYNHEFA